MGFLDNLKGSISQGADRVKFETEKIQRTGRLRYKVVASFWYGATQSSSEESGEYLMLDLRHSPYGAGWWIAGVERLVFLDQSQILWVGGDGSLALYSPVPLTNFKPELYATPRAFEVQVVPR